MYRSTRAACEARLGDSSVFRLLAQHGHRLFTDEAFADLFTQLGRRSIPPRIVAVVIHHTRQAVVRLGRRRSPRRPGR